MPNLFFSQVLLIHLPISPSFNQHKRFSQPQGVQTLTDTLHLHRGGLVYSAQLHQEFKDEAFVVIELDHTLGRAYQLRLGVVHFCFEKKLEGDQPWGWAIRIHIYIYTPYKTNMSPENEPGSNMKGSVFQLSIFRGELLVSGRDTVTSHLYPPRNYNVPV